MECWQWHGSCDDQEMLLKRRGHLNSLLQRLHRLLPSLAPCSWCVALQRRSVEEVRLGTSCDLCWSLGLELRNVLSGVRVTVLAGLEKACAVAWRLRPHKVTERVQTDVGTSPPHSDLRLRWIWSTSRGARQASM